MPSQAAVVHRAVEVGEAVVQRDGAAVGEVGQVGAEDAQRAQRHDEGLDPALGDEQAVGQAEHRAQHQGQGHAHRHDQHRRADRAAAPVHHQDDAAGDQRGHRAHRQVDAAGDDDEAHAHRDDADEGGAGEHVQRVVQRREVAVQRRAGNAQQQQADDGTKAVQAAPEGRGARAAPFQRVPVAWAISSSSVSSSSCSVAVMCPARMTTTRWHRPISSTSSDEMTITAWPSRASRWIRK